ncbi:FAD-dependent oxidoreductase [Streptomyces monticola]|uniref:ferredoxin--NADP(+) reductase n=1 Tax=Streptomyces monticola TaxID=2666263 RepID=A0ABW2JEF5_9ACTN
MPYAITQNCCSDATCVAVCPVNCIHPTPEERAFGSTELLHIDPKACIDCGACADACPVDAIFPTDSLSAAQREYAEINAAYYEGGGTGADAGGAAEERAPQPADPGPNFHVWGAPVFERSLPSDFAPIRVAVVGTGPAGMYAAEDLLLHTSAEVTLIDRLPVAGGLVRYGVAPDHPATKKVGETFARFHSHPRVRLQLGLEVGRDLTADELAAHHDAVIYAVGAATDRRLGIPGEDSPGTVSATTFVAWYNAHPEVAPDAVDLSAERVVVVGNGNVALDVARILVSDPDALAATDIADHALRALRTSNVREVVLLGRRGPEDASYTRTELLALKHLDGVELLVDDHDPRIGAAIDAAGPGDKAAVLQGVTRAAPDYAPAPAPGRRIVFRFHSAPVAAVDGDPAGAADAHGLRGVRVTSGAAEAAAQAGSAPAEAAAEADLATAAAEFEIPAGLLLRAVGYRGAPIPGLPFDEATGTVPHEDGRVLGRPGTYVVGWIKRGPSGGIGTNRGCAAETVGTLLADAVAGALPTPAYAPKAFPRLARRRNRQVVDARGLAAINRAEEARGHRDGRPRVKLATVGELVATARSRRLGRG